MSGTCSNGGAWDSGPKVEEPASQKTITTPDPTTHTIVVQEETLITAPATNPILPVTNAAPPAPTSTTIDYNHFIIIFYDNREDNCDDLHDYADRYPRPRIFSAVQKQQLSDRGARKKRRRTYDRRNWRKPHYAGQKPDTITEKLTRRFGRSATGFLHHKRDITPLSLYTQESTIGSSSSSPTANPTYSHSSSRTNTAVPPPSSIPIQLSPQAPSQAVVTPAPVPAPTLRPIPRGIPAQFAPAQHAPTNFAPTQLSPPRITDTHFPPAHLAGARLAPAPTPPLPPSPAPALVPIPRPPRQTQPAPSNRHTQITPELSDTGFYLQRAELAAESSRELINLPRRGPRRGLTPSICSEMHAAGPSMPIITDDGVILTANMERLDEDDVVPGCDGVDERNQHHIMSFMDYDPAREMALPAYAAVWGESDRGVVDRKSWMR
ncbi:hypothetical protein BDW42DRAFT_191125 [Aspergillus taichungensis]|uniref:Uncharacterized protein n=1 Tax=Aspergillus taichungensis TaxID=482145 RepID=A0A2J5I5J9_9EURO|nr:hypothetical protein BDW42DRAFT_191125 [Aspergillus taichungensis]